MAQLPQTYLMVRDVGESLAFYRDVVGLEPTDVAREDGRVKFGTEGHELVVEEDFDEALLDRFGLDAPGDDRGRGVITVVEVDDVEAVHERARAADATVLLEPQVVDWGRKLCLVEDPDGYVLELSRPAD